VSNVPGSAPFFSVLSVTVLDEFTLDFNDEFFVRGRVNTYGHNVQRMRGPPFQRQPGGRLIVLVTVPTTLVIYNLRFPCYA